MLMTVNQIRSTIRKIIIREDTSHEDKLASMIGTLDVENVVQALLLGETIGLIEEYSEQKAEFLSGDVITWNVNLKRSFAEKIEAAILSNPNPSVSYPFTSSRNYELLHYNENDLPEYTDISFRTLV